MAATARLAGMQSHVATRKFVNELNDKWKIEDLSVQTVIPLTLETYNSIRLKRLRLPKVEVVPWNLPSLTYAILNLLPATETGSTSLIIPSEAGANTRNQLP